MKKNNVFTIVNSLPLKQIQTNHKNIVEIIFQLYGHCSKTATRTAIHSEKTATSHHLPKLHIKENTATKIAPATKLPPTIQEIGTKTPPIIQKNSHQSPLTTQKITTIHQKTIEKIQKRKEN